MTSEEQQDLAPSAGLIPLKTWSVRQGRTHDYVRQFWRKRPGFPDPVGESPAVGRHGGGRGELLFDESALNGWLAAQSDLRPPDRIELSALGIGAEDRVTLGRFADAIDKGRKTVTQHRGREGFPEPGTDGLYRAGDLAEYWNARTGRRGKGRKGNNGGKLPMLGDTG
jgi:hypothetical protein